MTLIFSDSLCMKQNAMIGVKDRKQTPTQKCEV